MPSVSRSTPCREASENSQSTLASSSRVTVLALLTCRKASRSDHRTRTCVTYRRPTRALPFPSSVRSLARTAAVIGQRSPAVAHTTTRSCPGGPTGDGGELAQRPPRPCQPGGVLGLPLLDLAERVLIAGWRRQHVLGQQPER